MRLNTACVFLNGTFKLTFCHVIFCAHNEKENKVVKVIKAFLMKMILGKQLIYKKIKYYGLYIIPEQ